MRGKAGVSIRAIGSLRWGSRAPPVRSELFRRRRAFRQVCDGPGPDAPVAFRYAEKPLDYSLEEFGRTGLAAFGQSRRPGFTG